MPTSVQPLNPYSGRDTAWLVDAQAAARPDKVFLAWEPLTEAGRTWTYGQFAEETKAYAAGLAERGIGPGDVVILHMGNSPQFLFLWFAIGRLGAVVVTTNTRSTAEEMAYFIAHSQAKAAITQPAHAALVEAAAGGRLSFIACADTDWGEAAPAARPDSQLPLEALRGDPARVPARTPDPMAPSSVQYTSGTTARPKGVLWTHANALFGGKTTAAHLGLTDADVTPVYLPLFHTNALVWSTMSTFWSGGTIVLMPRFTASRFWEFALGHGCTWSAMVGFPMQALMQQETPAGHRIRMLGLGAGDIPSTAAKWGARAIGWFGMTETVGQPIMSDMTLPGPPGSMGRVAAEYEVAVRREDGTDAAPGEIGSLWVRGVPGISLVLRYLNNPEATAAAFDGDGWFDTGDLARFDAAGHMFYAGRAKDMLKVGGENVAAVEIETVVMRAAGVVEVAVVGRPDPMRDEVPVAFVVARNPGPALEAEILALCEAALSDFKRPRQVIFVDDLPKGLLDKVLKRDLRARLTV